MDIIFLGTPDFAVPALRRLIDAPDIHVRMVISQPDRKRSRNKFMPTPVKQLALEHGIPVLTPEKINRQVIIDQMLAVKPDFIVVIAFGQIIGRRILEAFKDRIINIHGSLLPAYRGAAPIQRALMDGLEETGVTAMMVEREMDAGDMLERRRLPILPEDDFETLSARLADIGADLIVEVLRDFERYFSSRQAQEPSAVSFADKIGKSEAPLDFALPARTLVNRVRTLHDWPGAKFSLDGEIYRVHSAHAEGESTYATTGEIRRADANGLAITTGCGLLVIDRIQAPSKKAMPIAAFLAGHPIAVGNCTEPIEMSEEA